MTGVTCEGRSWRIFRPDWDGTPDEIAEWAQERYAEEGLGLLAVERSHDGAFLSMCGLHHLEALPDDVEIAWRLAVSIGSPALYAINAERWRARAHR